MCRPAEPPEGQNAFGEKQHVVLIENGIIKMSDECLSHLVFFTLKDPTDGNVSHLVGECHRYLKNHPGVVSFFAGTLASEYDRPVNDRDFHVCLNVVFDSRASHDTYQTAADHLAFIESNRDSWAQVRVFDADVT